MKNNNIVKYIFLILVSVFMLSACTKKSEDILFFETKIQQVFGKEITKIKQEDNVITGIINFSGKDEILYFDTEERIITSNILQKKLCEDLVNYLPTNKQKIVSKVSFDMININRRDISSLNYDDKVTFFIITNEDLSILAIEDFSYLESLLKDNNKNIEINIMNTSSDFSNKELDALKEENYKDIDQILNIKIDKKEITYKRLFKEEDKFIEDETFNIKRQLKNNKVCNA